MEMNQISQGKKEMDSRNIRAAMEFCIGQILKNLDRFTDCFPKAYSEGNIYRPTPNEGWTTGFWTGELWLGYEWCGGEDSRSERLREAADQLMRRYHPEEAVQAGASFIVSPGFDPEVVDYCLERKIPVIPGCATASEMAQAVKRGLRAVKFFPAGAMGGLEMFKALAAPYHTLSFMPTEGIQAGNVRTYLEYPRIFACGGSWMVKKDLIADGNFEKIRELAREAAQIVKEVRG